MRIFIFYYDDKLSCSIRTLEYPPRPMMPNIVYAGGIHIKPPKGLSKVISLKFIKKNFSSNFPSLLIFKSHTSQGCMQWLHLYLAWFVDLKLTKDLSYILMHSFHRN